MKRGHEFQLGMSAGLAVADLAMGKLIELYESPPDHATDEEREVLRVMLPFLRQNVELWRTALARLRARLPDPPAEEMLAVANALDEDDSAPCPSCGANVPGVHEHGVLRHESCGYCAHPSSDFRPDHQGMPDSPGAWVCCVCDEEVGRG